MDEIFFEKISVSHEYLKIYGKNSPGGGGGELSGEEFTKGNLIGANWLGGKFSRGNSPRREQRKYMKKGNFNNKTT